MSHRLFTPASARETLALVRDAAERLRRQYRALVSRAPRRIAGEQPVDPDYFVRLERLYATLGAIRRHGVRVRDLRRGLLGFPARRAGRPVELCWRIGEPPARIWLEGPGGRRRTPPGDDGRWDVR